MSIQLTGRTGMGKTAKRLKSLIVNDLQIHDKFSNFSGHQVN